MFPFRVGSVKVGRILGFEIEINYTWLIVFFLVAFSLAYSYFPQYYPQQSQAANLFDGVITTLLFFASVVIHELAHSYVARRNNIPIRKITLFIFGGVAQMGAEPKSAIEEFKMAVAGPLASLCLSAIFGVVYLLTRYLIGMASVVYAPFYWLFFINILLVVFNLAPGFPLDGGRILRAALWAGFKDLKRATRIASRSGQALAFIMIALGLVGVLFGDISSLWLVLLGWFLNQASQTSYRQLVLKEALSGVRVEEIMSKDVLTVAPSVSLDDLVNKYFFEHRFSRFPVADEGKLIGVITLHDVKEIPKENWERVTAAEVVEPLPKSHTIGPSEQAVDALMQMAKEETGHLLVIEDETLVGLVTRSDIIRLIRIKSELEI